MTERPLVEKKLALAESYVADLRRLARTDRLDSDVRERRFVEHSLQLAIQACLDVASHVVSSERLGEPTTNRSMFSRLEQAGWVDASMASTMTKVVGLRNVLVHGYADVDTNVVREVVDHRLDDLLAFVAAIRRGLERP